MIERGWGLLEWQPWPDRDGAASVGSPGAVYEHLSAAHLAAYYEARHRWQRDQHTAEARHRHALEFARYLVEIGRLSG